LNEEPFGDGSLKMGHLSNLDEAGWRGSLAKVISPPPPIKFLTGKKTWQIYQDKSESPVSL
jgi:hypothetical protein